MTGRKHDTEFAIEIHDLTKRFIVNHSGAGSLKTAVMGRYRKSHREEFEALRGVSLNIPWGQCVSIVGRNGAGKSTLLSLLAKVYKPTSGTIKINGSVSPLLELGAGFHPDLTGLENIVMNGVILGMSRKEMIKRVDTIVDFAELQDKIDTPLRTYSSGMMMRLGFSIAMHVDSDMLIVDEALSVGDYVFQEKSLNYIRKYREAGGTIFLVSHDLGPVQEISDRVVWMDKGRIVMDGEPAHVISKYLADEAPQ